MSEIACKVKMRREDMSKTHLFDTDIYIHTFKVICFIVRGNGQLRITE